MISRKKFLSYIESIDESNVEIRAAECFPSSYSRNCFEEAEISGSITVRLDYRTASDKVKIVKFLLEKN
jgi:hypothetical protein